MDDSDDTGLTAAHVRVLKQGDAFALFDQYGDIRPSRGGESGLYHDGTRFLSRFHLELEGARPFLLSSTVRDDNDQLVVALTNPDLSRNGAAAMPLGALHLAWRKLLWKSVLYQELRIANHALEAHHFSISMDFAADFADIYEIRGKPRNVHGRILDPKFGGGTALLSYRGLDDVLRRTLVDFYPAPEQLAADCAAFHVSLEPRESTVIAISVACERESITVPVFSFERARAEVRTDLEWQAAQYSHIQTENGQFNALVRRTMDDLHMLTTVLPTGPYPYAGVPWFNTPFGRDGIITAFECLWLNPSLARGVLAYLAETQATELNPAQDAEPGKILHETRKGEMAALGEMPFARYYGTVDATPLFIVLAGAYYERTGDRGFIRAMWESIEAALHWMERYGDRDGDGFIEYQSRANDGLVHQGWKDSDDAVFHADGRLARGAIALCEVQGYAFAAWQAAAKLASALDCAEKADEFTRRAATLRERFDAAFWCDPLSLYALALDGEKRPCCVRTSNAGQCLFSGIASAERAARVAEALLRPESFSGWGIRTLAAGEPHYNPMGYHTGTVWPHDNALITYGMTRYGLRTPAVEIFQGFFDAAMACELNRMPELFCGFPREPGEGPVRYPVACAPQAWSCAALFLFLQSCLGLTVNALDRRISFAHPLLPPFLQKLRISNLVAGDASADLEIIRHQEDITVHVLPQTGDLDIVVLP